MKNTATILIASTTGPSAGLVRGRKPWHAGGEVTGVGGSAWAEPTPYGMVLVRAAR